jgi:hypothetical protein
MATKPVVCKACRKGTGAFLRRATKSANALPPQRFIVVARKQCRGSSVCDAVFCKWRRPRATRSPSPRLGWPQRSSRPGMAFRCVTNGGPLHSGSNNKVFALCRRAQTPSEARRHQQSVRNGQSATMPPRTCWLLAMSNVGAAPPGGEMSIWYICDQGSQTGPFNLECAYLRTRDPARLHVWREGLGNWALSKDLPKLAGCIRPGPPKCDTPPMAPAIIVEPRRCVQSIPTRKSRFSWAKISSSNGEVRSLKDGIVRTVSRTGSSNSLGT